MSNGANSGFLPDLEFSQNVQGNETLAVCIPASNEPSLLPLFQSLFKCKPVPSVLVVVVFNAPEDAPENHKKTNEIAFRELRDFLQTNHIWFGTRLAVFNQLPAKKSGVGLARKLAMDMACELCGPLLSETVLACLDADCEVEDNYLQELRTFFSSHKHVQAASVYFEHPLPPEDELQKAIAVYEMHLRYLKNALEWCGYPWFYHTVGSSMAVRASAYRANGGMNTRKAGEDFYFLHKLMPLGFAELNTTTVYPKARYSDRVPFGTGRSMMELRDNNGKLSTYHLDSFKVLSAFFSALKANQGIGSWYTNGSLHPVLVAFFDSEGLVKEWQRCLENTATPDAALRRFYRWFSGFRIIHCLHYLRDNAFPMQPVHQEVQKLADELGFHMVGDIHAWLRQRDKKNNPAIAGQF